MLHCNRC